VPPLHHCKLKVGFVLAPHFTLTAFAGFVDALRLAGDEGDRSRRVQSDWDILGHSSEPIPSSCGAMVQPTARLEEPQGYDLVVVVGGLIHGRQQVPDAVYRFLQAAAQRGLPLVGLCTGSFILARAGLLDHYLTCVSWFHREEFEREFPHCRVTSKQMYVVDRDRMTCAGGTSVVHLAAHLIEQRIGRASAVKALRIMLEDQPLPSRALQPESVVTHKSRDPVVHKAMLLIEQHLQKPGPVSQSYELLGVGQRQLERRFQLDIGMSPAQYRTKLRLQRAEWLLKSTRMSVTDVAIECGFQDSSSLSRALKQLKGISPSGLKSSASPSPAQ
jgi:transcriptional regulator GlxA family with amidase domain